MHAIWILLWSCMTHPKAMYYTYAVATGLLELWMIEVTNAIYRES